MAVFSAARDGLMTPGKFRRVPESGVSVVGVVLWIDVPFIAK